MRIELRPIRPYDFRLGLRLFGTFHDVMDRYGPDSYTRVLRVGSKPVLTKATSVGDVEDPLLLVSTNRDDVDRHALAELLNWQFNTSADVRPFYEVARRDPVMGPVIKRLYGLKSMRLPTIFEMVVIAITEQQLNLPVSVKIRNRLVEAFGERVVEDGETYFAFPTPERLASATVEDLRAVSLSRAKARYIIDIAAQVEDGTLDLESLKTCGNEDVITRITAIRGLGRWTAEYLLVRGLGRSDVAPADDLGLRDKVGIYLGPGQRVSAEEARALLEPWGPYKGWVTLYLFADGWLRRAEGRLQ